MSIIKNMDDNEIQQALDERADHIPKDQLLTMTAQGVFFESVYKSLTSRGTKLVVGPRGCGKTHMMRYAALVCSNDPKLPLGVYISFNRYYRLEPLLKSRSNAINLFHAWVLARILLGLQETVDGIDGSFGNVVGVDSESLMSLIGRLERSLSLTSKDEEIINDLNIEAVKSRLDIASGYLGRKRTVIFMDDAALTLTPDYLIEFFDIVRVLRSSTISPKASVYPATDFGPRFHAKHEAEVVKIWLPIDRFDYEEIMGNIASSRLKSLSIPDDVNAVLKYASFGVPRAYLTMIREYERESGGQQIKLNKVIDAQISAKRAEFDSMKLKMPRFDTLVEVGGVFFTAMVDSIASGQSEGQVSNESQFTIGIVDSEIDENPLFERMLNLLIEAGLVYEGNTVSHGPERVYRRFIPHVAALISARALSSRTRGAATKPTLEKFRAKAAKHPVRRTIKRLLGTENLESLKIDLPECSNCGVSRLKDQQRFCHNCGAQLLDDSTFNKCMAVELTSVPGLTKWQQERIENLARVRTIGDFLAIQDPGTELRKIHRVGNKKASKIAELVSSFVEDFLS
jgi:hypothetical protein